MNIILSSLVGQMKKLDGPDLETAVAVASYEVPVIRVSS